MRLDPKIAKSNPKFFNYISADMSKLADDTFMVGALSRFGRMDPSKAKQILKFGSGPELLMVDFDEDLLKNVDRPEKSGTVQVDTHFVQQFEKNEDLVITGNGKTVHGIGMFILQHIVQIAAGRHMGQAFAKGVYGNTAAHPWKKKE